MLIVALKKNNPGCNCCGPNCVCTNKTCLSETWNPSGGLSCKCTSNADCLVIENIGSISVTLAGNGTGTQVGACNKPTCAWDGTFVVPCGMDPNNYGYYAWQKAVFVCTRYNGFTYRDYYYVQEVRISMAALGTADKTSPASFSISVILLSSTQDVAMGGSLGISTTWSNTLVGITHTGGSSASYFYGGTLLDMYQWVEETCPKIDCKPVAQIVQCETTLTQTSSSSNAGTTGQAGCYPDPANVTVTLSW